MLLCALVNDPALQIILKLSGVKQQFDFSHSFMSQESAKGLAGQFSYRVFHIVVVRCWLCCDHLWAQLDWTSQMAHTDGYHWMLLSAGCSTGSIDVALQGSCTSYTGIISPPE